MPNIVVYSFYNTYAQHCSVILLIATFYTRFEFVLRRRYSNLSFILWREDEKCLKPMCEALLETNV